MKKRGADVLLTGETDPAIALAHIIAGEALPRSALRHHHGSLQIARPVLAPLTEQTSPPFIPDVQICPGTGT